MTSALTTNCGPFFPALTDSKELRIMKLAPAPISVRKPHGHCDCAPVRGLCSRSYSAERSHAARVRHVEAHLILKPLYLPQPVFDRPPLLPHCSQSKCIKIGPSKYAVKQPIRYKIAEHQRTIRLKRLAVWHVLASLGSQAPVRA